MRIALASLVLLVLGLSAARAQDEAIPIAVDRIAGFEVTEAHLDWVRAWLRAHLHTDHLAGIEVDVRNRSHPIADYRVEARLTPRDSGTYRVQRVVRFGHRTWPTWVPQKTDFVGDWAVDDQDRVQRIFDIDGERKVMSLDETLSYQEVLDVLRVIARNGVRFATDGGDEYRPSLRRVYSICRDKGRIEIKSGGPWQGTWIAGHLENDAFVVEAQGGYIS